MASEQQHYRAQRILHGDHWLQDAVLSVASQGNISAIAAYDPQQHRTVTDLGAVNLMPGLIDSHVHGSQGCDVMDATHASLNTMSRYFASLGVTAFVATTVTAPVAKIRAALAQVAKSKQQGALRVPRSSVRI